MIKSIPGIAREDHKPIVFVHVPKTAGSTLKRVIQRQYPDSRTAHIEGEGLAAQYRAFRALPAAERQKVRCVMGHIPYGVHHWLPAGARYITMLRHPLEWALSFHAYVQRMPFFDDDPDMKAFHGVRSLDIEGFVDSLKRSHLSNMQTRLISGQVDALDILPPYPPLPEGVLTTAIDNLRNEFACVGIVERFDESLVLMKRTLSWGTIFYRRLNVSERRLSREQIKPALVDRILSENQLDLQLYKEGCRLLDAEIASAGQEFQAELARFQRNNALFNRMMPIYEAVGLHRARRILRRLARAMD